MSILHLCLIMMDLHVFTGACHSHSFESTPDIFDEIETKWKYDTSLEKIMFISEFLTDLSDLDIPGSPLEKRSHNNHTAYPVNREKCDKASKIFLNEKENESIPRLETLCLIIIIEGDNDIATNVSHQLTTGVRLPIVTRHQSSPSPDRDKYCVDLKRSLSRALDSEAVSVCVSSPNRLSSLKSSSLTESFTFPTSSSSTERLTSLTSSCSNERLMCPTLSSSIERLMSPTSSCSTERLTSLTLSSSTERLTSPTSSSTERLMSPTSSCSTERLTSLTLSSSTERLTSPTSSSTERLTFSTSSSSTERLTSPTSSSTSDMVLDIDETDDVILCTGASLGDTYRFALKQELKCKIQLRRHMSQQEEIFIDARDTCMAEPYPNVAKVKVSRKERNRHHAKASREKARKAFQELKESYISLREINHELKYEIEELRARASAMTSWTQVHERFCGLRFRHLFV